MSDYAFHIQTLSYQFRLKKGHIYFEWRKASSMVFTRADLLKFHREY